MSKIKQVIVLRVKYPHPQKDGEFFKPRAGKLIAQASHACMKFLVDKIKIKEEFSEVELKWMNSLFTKICLRVDSEEELDAIHKKALEAGLTSKLIVDSGKTEFNGVPTKTCIAIGPNFSSEIDEITSELKLY